MSDLSLGSWPLLWSFWLDETRSLHDFIPLISKQDFESRHDYYMRVNVFSIAWHDFESRRELSYIWFQDSNSKVKQDFWSNAFMTRLRTLTNHNNSNHDTTSDDRLSVENLSSSVFMTRLWARSAKRSFSKSRRRRWAKVIFHVMDQSICWLAAGAPKTKQFRCRQERVGWQW